MSIKITGVILVEGLASDGAQTVIQVDVADLPNAGNVQGNDLVPTSPTMDTLATALRTAQARTLAMLTAGL